VASSAEPATPAPTAAPRVVVICNDCGGKPIPIIRFQYGSAVVPTDVEPMLQEVVLVMKAHPEIKLVAIEGHTDLDEGRRIAVDLARRRAEAVRDRLVKRGIEPDRLVVKAHGSTKPLADNATPVGRAHNRRVQFHVEERQGP
jgi:outer membrane protein OmpA-like peptidoglycan-associated protein